MSAFSNVAASKQRMYAGTYRIIPRVEWTSLLERDFGLPDWAALYPLNNKGQPVELLPPRMACKLFHDGVYIIKKGEENQKYIQDRIPEIAHRFYKKKQWRKQFFEAARRVCCRLARGLGFRTNCLAEDAFVHVILNHSFELGWRRINEFIEPLPETDKDKDFARVIRLGTNEDIANLMRGVDGGPQPTTSSKPVKAGKTSAAVSAAGKTDVRDVKQWFKMYETGRDHMFDHIVRIEDDEIEGSSVASTASYNTLDGDFRSRSSTIGSEDGSAAVDSAAGGGPISPLSNPSLSPAPLGSSAFDFAISAAIATEEAAAVDIAAEGVKEVNLGAN